MIYDDKIPFNGNIFICFLVDEKVPVNGENVSEAMAGVGPRRLRIAR